MLERFIPRPAEIRNTAIAKLIRANIMSRFEKMPFVPTKTSRKNTGDSSTAFVKKNPRTMLKAAATANTTPIATTVGVLVPLFLKTIISKKHSNNTNTTMLGYTDAMIFLAASDCILPCSTVVLSTAKTSKAIVKILLSRITKSFKMLAKKLRVTL